MTKKFILAVCVAAVAFAACEKENNDKVHLATMYGEITSMGMTVTGTTNYTWENDKLVKVVDSSFLNGNLIAVLDETLVYEGGVCIERYSADGTYHHYYSYEGGRLKKAVDIMRGDTSAITEIMEWTSNNKVAKLKFTTGDAVVYAHYTWQDGDLKEIVHERVSPTAETKTYSYSYDNHTSVYVDFPLAYLVQDIYHLIKDSKHNVTLPDHTLNYEKGRLVSDFNDDGSEKIYYTYTDGTGRRK